MNYTYLVINDYRKQVIAIHYYDGNFGVFAYPEKSRNFKVYKNCDARQFAALILKEHNIKLRGMITERGTMSLL